MKLFILILISFDLNSIDCEDKFVCENDTRVKKQRTDAVNAFKDKDLRSFYIVSYSILIDSESQPHDFIPPEILSGEEVENIFMFKIEYGHVYFKFNQIASRSSFT
jgi:hypothetical protein